MPNYNCTGDLLHSLSLPRRLDTSARSRSRLVAPEPAASSSCGRPVRTCYLLESPRSPGRVRTRAVTRPKKFGSKAKMAEFRLREGRVDVALTISVGSPATPLSVRRGGAAAARHPRRAEVARQVPAPAGMCPAPKGNQSLGLRVKFLNRLIFNPSRAVGVRHRRQGRSVAPFPFYPRCSRSSNRSVGAGTRHHRRRHCRRRSQSLRAGSNHLGRSPRRHSLTQPTIWVRGHVRAVPLPGGLLFTSRRAAAESPTTLSQTRRLIAAPLTF